LSKFRRFSREFKLSLCFEIVNGRVSKSRALREHSLSPGLLDKWLDQYKRLGDEAFPNSLGDADLPLTDSKRARELEALVGRLTLELEFLKDVVKKGEQLRAKRQK
jgi:transposase-like protein